MGNSGGSGSRKHSIENGTVWLSSPRWITKIMRYEPNWIERVAALDVMELAAWHRNAHLLLSHACINTPKQDLHEKILINTRCRENEKVKIKIVDGVLNIEGYASSSNENEEIRATKLEESDTMKYIRKLILPENIDEGKVSATRQDGVVSIQIYKMEERKPKVVNIPILSQNIKSEYGRS